MDATTMIIRNSIQNGDSTHHHDQSIYPVSFKPINSNVSSTTKLLPPLELFSLFIFFPFCLFFTISNNQFTNRHQILVPHLNADFPVWIDHINHHPWRCVDRLLKCYTVHFSSLSRSILFSRLMMPVSIAQNGLSYILLSDFYGGLTFLQNPSIGRLCRVFPQSLPAVPCRSGFSALYSSFFFPLCQLIF